VKLIDGYWVATALFIDLHNGLNNDLISESQRSEEYEMEKKVQIAVAGTGYVELSIASLLSQQHKVYAMDIIPKKMERIYICKSLI